MTHLKRQKLISSTQVRGYNTSCVARPPLITVMRKCVIWKALCTYILYARIRL